MKDLKYLDIVLVDFGNDIIGSEQGGIRPAIVVQNNVGNKYSSTTIVLPLTSQIKSLNQPTHTLLKKTRNIGLNDDSMVLAECIRQVSKERIIKYCGKVINKKEKEEIRRAYIAIFENVA